MSSNEKTVESPCNGECLIDLDTGYCEGCMRTMKEIRRWTYFSDEERREVLEKVRLRRSGVYDEPED